MDKKKRRAIGAHYTTEQNILKVIQPLFLDDLRKELDALKLRRDTAQHNALRVFQKKLSEIRCFDPACGCGNFLVIAYRELRALETEVLLALNKNRELDVADLSKVDVNQFYGIELEEFPARIAEIALWMMDHIMNMRLSEALGGYFPRIPLIKSPTIQATDALEVDWREILKPEVCSYVLGNPPFAGAKYQSPKQRAQVAKIANLTGKQGTLDLVAAWFIKAAQYIQGSKCHIGFVATNSITQGEQVGELWPLLFARHQLTISYAHRTFAWGSEVRGKANVHVVIVGLSSKGQEPANKRLFDYPDITGSPSETTVSVISPYLFDAGGLSNPETVVLETSATPSGLPRMLSGTQPIDFEQYVMDDSQRDELIAKEPKADRFIRPYIGSDGFINGERSWILALQKASPSELKEMPEVLRRMQTVTAKRLESTRPQTNRIAKTPSLYGVTVAPLSQFLVVPKVSSSRREYVPIAYLNPPTIPSDLVFVIENATPWLFGMLTSKMHMSWLSNIGGRLKSDYRYSIGLVYNAFPWPASAIDAELTKLAEAILDARTEHPSETLAGLYDPNTMPVKLRRAHERLDGYVDRLYRKEPFASDRQRAEFLMTRYEKEMAPLFPVKSVKSKRQKKLLAN